ncbi:MAG: septal ring lytic transglycosylase RlpA family protein [Gammaproteobacteria bacterium]
MRDSRSAAAALVTALLAGCATAPTQDPAPRYSQDIDGAPARVDIDVLAVPDAIPRHEPRATRGNPPFYEVDGQRYFVMGSGSGHVERGIASWYGTKFHGRTTSSGEPYDMFAMTAAHRNLPLPSFAKVTNLQNGRSIVVRINDRGPFAHNRIVDLSYAAAVRLGIVGEGTGLVELRVLDPDRPEGPVVPEDPVGPPPRLFVQVGAFASRDNAERVVERLYAAQLYNVELTPHEFGTPLWRVRAGPLADVEEVDAVAQKISDAGFPEARVVIE